MKSQKFFAELALKEQRPAELQQARALVDSAQKDADSHPKSNKNDKFLLDYANARLLLEEQSLHKAVDGFTALYAEAQPAGRLKYEFLAKVGLGLCYKQNKEDWPKAEAAFEEAQGIAEAIRDTLDPGERIRFLDGEEILGIKHGLPAKELSWIRGVMGRDAPQGAEQKGLWAKPRCCRDHKGPVLR